MSARRMASLLPVLVGLACTCSAARVITLDDPSALPAALGGPKVQDAAAEKATLLVKDFDGSLKMLEVRPEVAALQLLKLSDTEKAATSKTLQDRETLIAKVLKENYPLFLELQNMRQAGIGGGGGGEGRDMEEVREQRRGMMEKMQIFRDKAKDLLEPTLMDRLSKDLTESNAGELKRLVQEYNAAAMENQRGQRMPGGSGGGAPKGESGTDQAMAPEKEPGNTRPVRGKVGSGGGGRGERRGEMAPQRVEIGMTLREMARSLKSVVNERKDRADTILKAANATPEQEAKIRAIFREMGAQAAVGTPNQEDRGAAMRKVLEILTPEQREAALKEIRR